MSVFTKDHETNSVRGTLLLDELPVPSAWSLERSVMEVQHRGAAGKSCHQWMSLNHF